MILKPRQQTQSTFIMQNVNISIAYLPADDKLTERIEISITKPKKQDEEKQYKRTTTIFEDNTRKIQIFNKNKERKFKSIDQLDMTELKYYYNKRNEKIALLSLIILNAMPYGQEHNFEEQIAEQMVNIDERKDLASIWKQFNDLTIIYKTANGVEQKLNVIKTVTNEKTKYDVILDYQAKANKDGNSYLGLCSTPWLAIKNESLYIFKSPYRILCRATELKGNFEPFLENGEIVFLDAETKEYFPLKRSKAWVEKAKAIKNKKVEHSTDIIGFYKPNDSSIKPFIPTSLSANVPDINSDFGAPQFEDLPSSNTNAYSQSQFGNSEYNSDDLPF